MGKTAVNLASMFLHPGEMALLTRPSRVTTVLGSCVAITMRVRDGRLGVDRPLPAAPCLRAVRESSLGGARPLCGFGDRAHVGQFRPARRSAPANSR